MYAIMVMTMLHCTQMWPCWHPINEERYGELSTCQFVLMHTPRKNRELHCRPVESEAELPNPFEDVPP